MEELKRRVISCQSKWNVAQTVQLDYYTSSVGQNYAILVTKGLWYRVRLFVEDEHPNCPESEFPLKGEFFRLEQEDLVYHDHMTLYGAQRRVQQFRDFFDKPYFNVARHQILDQAGYFTPFFIRKVPKDYWMNPDKGDIISTPFVKLAVHTAIYLGNCQVAHISGHGGKKADGVARIGQLIGDFVAKGTDKIRIVCLPLRIRSREHIAQIAERLAAKKFRDGEYNLLQKNCQHFVFLCATGVEYAINFRMVLGKSE